MYNIAINILLVLDIFVALLLVLLVLMQRPKSEGLGAAFGGGMTEGLFGAQTTNVLQKATRWLTGFFFAAALLISMLYSKSARSDNRSVIQQQLVNAPVPKAPTEQDIEKLVGDKLLNSVHSGTSATASGTQSGSGTSASPSAEGTPGSSLQAPPIQLGVPATGGTNGGGIDLQPGAGAAGGTDLLHTGTAAAPKKDGK